MPYNPEIHSIVVISKKHKTTLKKLAKNQRRTLQATLELLIEQEADRQKRKKSGDA